MYSITFASSGSGGPSSSSSTRGSTAAGVQASAAKGAPCRLVGASVFVLSGMFVGPLPEELEREELDIGFAVAVGRSDRERSQAFLFPGGLKVQVAAAMNDVVAMDGRLETALVVLSAPSAGGRKPHIRRRERTFLR